MHSNVRIRTTSTGPGNTPHPPLSIVCLSRPDGGGHCTQWESSRHVISTTVVSVRPSVNDDDERVLAWKALSRPNDTGRLRPCSG